MKYIWKYLIVERLLTHDCMYMYMYTNNKYIRYRMTKSNKNPLCFTFCEQLILIRSLSHIQNYLISFHQPFIHQVLFIFTFNFNFPIKTIIIILLEVFLSVLILSGRFEFIPLHKMLHNHWCLVLLINCV